MEEVSDHYFALQNIHPFMTKNFFWSILSYKDLIKSINILTNRGDPVHAIFYFKNENDKTKVLDEIKQKNIHNEINLNLDKLGSVIPSPKDIITNNQEFKFIIEYHKLCETEYTLSLKEPGLIYNNQDIMNRYSKAIKSLIKTIGTNIIKGRSIMNISLPVIIFDKRTLLQVYAYEFSFTTYFLERAALCTDPIERLKWTGVFLFSQLHLSALQTKPFNPILGETFQIELGNSTKVYLEQTVNKPPTANFIVYGKNYKSYGHIITEASTGANSITANKLGNSLIEFKDGVKHKLYFPTVGIKGLTMGKRTFNYKNCAIVNDESTNVSLFFKFNPDEKSSFGKLFFSQKTTPDTARGQITDFSDIVFDSKGKHTLKKNAKSYATIDGQWTKYLSYSNTKYWEKSDYTLAKCYKPNFILPSDSTFREDLNFFLINDEINAQISKEKMENDQRADRKIRGKEAKEIEKK